MNQPMWSKQLCKLMEKNLINTLDVMEYAKVIEQDRPQKGMVMDHINNLYNKRILNIA